MRTRPLFLITLVFTLCLGLMSVSAQGSNLLVNPGFESPFTNQGGTPPRQVANGWTAWHTAASADQPNFENTQPEYFEAVRQDRIRSGSNAQRYESFFATHEGGVFQVVNGLPEDTEVTFSIYAYIWSSGLDDEDASEEDGDVIFQVGIDPTGGTDGSSDEIIWSVGSESYDEYSQYSVSAITESSTVSVWVRSKVGFPVKRSRVYLDDASLVAEGSVATQEPTEEPTQEVTAEPTAEPTEEPTQEVPTQEVTEEPTQEVPTQEVTEEPTQEVTEEPTQDPGTGGPIGGEFPGLITHTVQRGDTLSRLATRYESTIQAIQQANGIGSNTLIYVGQGLLIPVRYSTVTPTATPIPANTAVPIPPSSGTYRVQPGDTLSSIARRFNTTVAALAQLNGIVNPNNIFAGQLLSVPPTGGPGGTNPTPIPAVTVVVPTPIPPIGGPGTPVGGTYVIQPGDTLYRISLRFGVSLTDLIRANGITNPNVIFWGQRIVIP